MSHFFVAEQSSSASTYTSRFEYEYSHSGHLTVFNDLHNQKSLYYSYDIVGRIKSVVDQDGNVIEYTYDNSGNLDTYSYTFDAETTSVSYNHNNQTGQYTSTSFDTYNKSFSYDNSSLKRLNNIQLKNGSTNINDIDINYFDNVDVTNGTISTRVSSIEQTLGTSTNAYIESVTYTNNGYISTITVSIDGVSKTIEYYYDYLGQLTRENNELESYTITYKYFDNGNIEESKKYTHESGNINLGTLQSSKHYTYSLEWTDKLLTYTEKDAAGVTTLKLSYTYDNSGDSGNVVSITDTTNGGAPTTYTGFTWEGRTLTGMNITVSSSTKNITYKYNDAGIRTSQTIDGITTKYYLDGSRVLYETNGTDDIYYTYDVDGSLLSINLNGTEYFYVYNILGDVIYLLDGTGNIVVEYSYDAYGNILTKTDNSGISLATKNPYRYRGYRYDEETNLYYLQSRYYNPEAGRFINADGMLKASNSVLGYNMFTYTENNPVNYVDPSGYGVMCLVTAYVSSYYGGCNLEGGGGGGGGGVIVTLPGVAIATGTVVVGAVAITEVLNGSDNIKDFLDWAESGINKAINYLNTQTRKITTVLAISLANKINKKGVGAYVITFESGMKYVGKGTVYRMGISAAGIYALTGDKPRDFDFHPSVGQHYPQNANKDAFVMEYMLMVDNGYPNPKKLYNLIWSPGRKYYYQKYGDYYYKIEESGR